MADETSSPDPADEAAKAETIRITLPAKPETPTAKRETVRINLPGKSPIPGITPKKETTKIVTEAPTGSALATPVPSTPASGATPFVPPPPRPPSGIGAPPPPAKPMSGINPPPKPPMLAKPGLPMKPGAPAGAPPAPPAGAKPAVPGAPGASGIRPPGAPAASGVQPQPVTQKAAAPKKETARITLPPEGSKAGGLPKATVKMQQTQPLVRQPSASTIQSTPAIQTTMPASISSASHAPASDGALNVLAIVAFIVSIGAAVLAYLAYTTAQLAS